MCMIVGPWIEPFLEASIRSVVNLCDEFVVVDTSPGEQPNREMLDRLAREITHPAFIVYDLPRQGKFSFSAAREFAQSKSNHEWILWWDADEVMGENDIQPLRILVSNLKQNALAMGFHHFMITPNWIQPTDGDLKIKFFRKEFGSWSGDVHEYFSIRGDILETAYYKLFHYGYCRGQAEVFKRWQLYAELEDKPTWYWNTDPEHILDDRIANCVPFTGTHPKVVQPVLDSMFNGVEYVKLNTCEVLRRAGYVNSVLIDATKQTLTIKNT